MTIKSQQPIVSPMHESSEHEIRVQKIPMMSAEGINPWPNHKPVSHSISQAFELFSHDHTTQQHISLAGRLLIKRDHGKTFFGIIQDRSDRIQIYIRRDEVGEFCFESFKKYIDIGDIIWAKGTLFVTKTGETTLKVDSLSLLSKCLHPLPEKFHGLADIEVRYRQRYLDLISNIESREKFKKRSAIIKSIRAFFENYDFLEVETPMLHPIPGGAAAKPFVTHHNTYDIDLYLRIAPELYLKRLLVGGFDRVFEINRNFRNEGVSTRHNPEFTMLEFYMAHQDYIFGMDMIEKLFNHVITTTYNTTTTEFNGHIIDFGAPFKKMTVIESLIAIGNVPAYALSPEVIDNLLSHNNITVPNESSYGVKLFALFEALVEPNIIQPTFIIGYPIEISPLAKRDDNDPRIAARFELFICGMECANGFSELNDPFDQANRFRQQAQARVHGDHEAHYYDAEFIKALEFGMPPAVGVGIGIDRLIMILTHTLAIKDVILFPTLKILPTE